tara:strand:- start:118 stop:1284 length:1167 start_codon:yes stop_codon:yes gene_type:complete
MITNVRFIWQISALTILILLPSPITSAQTATSVHLTPPTLIDLSNHIEIAYDSIVDQYNFHGLAAYYNHPTLYVVRGDSIRSLAETEEYLLSGEGWLIASGRFSAIALRDPAGRVVFGGGNQKIFLSPSSRHSAPVFVSNKSALSELSPDLEAIKYAYLWRPFAFLASVTEKYFNYLQSFFTSWLITLLAFSLSIKLCLYPLNYATQVSQKRVAAVKANIEPIISEIKAHFDGEEAHNKIMQAHKDMGVTPFYTLKPLLITLLQIPVLIATFNALGEASIIQGAPLFWVTNLAYPDSVATLPFAIPLLGSEVSLLPFAMATATLALAFFTSDRQLSLSAVIMSAGFLILFYPFPAILVLYWTLVNLWHLTFHFIEQPIIKFLKRGQPI